MRTSGFGIFFVVICSSILFASCAFAQTMELDTDRPGTDYRNFDLASPDPNLCESACRQDAQNCKVWTYVKPGIQGPKARCWLKSGIPSAVKNSCCISGMIQLVPQTNAAENKALAPMQLPKVPMNVALPPGPPAKSGTGDKPGTSFAQGALQKSNLPQQKPVQQAGPQRKGALAAQAAVKLDPALMQKLQVFPSRDMMISSLMANQATTRMLQSFAGNSKMNVAELSKKSLDGKMAAVYPVGLVVPKGKKIDELNWTGGIKISLIKHIPTFFDPSGNTERLLGQIFVEGTFLTNYHSPLYLSASESFNADAFYLPGDNLPQSQQEAWQVGLLLFLPPAPSAYMIAVQGGSANLYWSDQNNFAKKLEAIHSSTIGGMVGMTLITPELIGNGLGRCSIYVTPAHNGEPFLFGGITITRL